MKPVRLVDTLSSRNKRLADYLARMDVRMRGRPILLCDRPSKDSLRATRKPKHFRAEEVGLEFFDLK